MFLFTYFSVFHQRLDFIKDQMCMFPSVISVRISEQVVQTQMQTRNSQWLIQRHTERFTDDCEHRNKTIFGFQGGQAANKNFTNKKKTEPVRAGRSGQGDRTV